MNLSGQFLLRHDYIIQSPKNSWNSNLYRQERHGVEKQSNLTIQEFWERYDGKWLVLRHKRFMFQFSVNIL